MKILTIGLIIFINFILQTTLFHYIKIYDIVLNTSLILVVCFAINSKKEKSAFIGFIIGILQDIVFGKALGVSALVYMLIGYVVGLTNRNIFKDNLMIPFVYTGLATVFYYLTSLLIIYLLGYNLEFFYIIRTMLPIEILYNSIISIFVYIYVSKVLRSVYKRY